MKKKLLRTGLFGGSVVLLLLPYLLDLGGLPWKDVYAAENSQTATLLDNKWLKITASAALEGEEVQWKIAYQKKKDIPARVCFALEIDGQKRNAGELIADEVWETGENGWINEKAFQRELTENKLQFTSRREKTDANELKLAVRYEEQLEKEPAAVTRFETKTPLVFTADFTGKESSEAASTPVNAPLVSEAADQGSIIISDKVINKARELEVKVSGAENDIYRVEDGAARKDYDSFADSVSSIYHLYVSDSGKVFIHFSGIPEEHDTASLEGAQVDVKYPRVGYLRQEDGNLQPIGAKVAITDIKTNDTIKSTWFGYPISIATIDLSSNLFSGAVTTGIASAKWDFEFFETNEDGSLEGKTVDFDAKVNPYITFNSLNGYGEKMTQGEFVQKETGTQKEGAVVAESAVAAGTVVDNKNKQQQYKNVYSCFKAYDQGWDTLGNPNFNKMSVTFPLEGQRNEFMIGTGGGAGYREWVTFASSAITPTKQSLPSKTIQPLTSPLADHAATGWEQRYWNDLDRTNDHEDGTFGEWDFLAHHRVAGHDADEETSLAAGLQKKADRYVTPGSEFYYFINQETINLASEGLIQPNQYEIIDSLPAGVELANENALTLYDLNGAEMGKVAYQVEGKQLHVTLSPQQAATINEQSRESAHYGKDFSLRVQVKVTNQMDDAIPDLMESQATTVFSYQNGTSFEAATNIVQTKIKPLTFDLTLAKTDGAGAPLAGAKFSLRGSGKAFEAASDDQGAIRFAGGVLEAGQEYTLEETAAPAGYRISGGPWLIKIAKDGSTATMMEQNAAGKTIQLTLTKPADPRAPILLTAPNEAIVNDALTEDEPSIIRICKQDAATKEALAGVGFTLTDNNGNVVHAGKTDEQGILEFADLDRGMRYMIEETTPLAGYVGLNEKLRLTFDEAGGKWKLTGEITEKEYQALDDSDGSQFAMTFEVPNQKKMPLPATDGKGTRKLTALSSSLLLLSGAYFAARARRRKEED